MKKNLLKLLLVCCTGILQAQLIINKLWDYGYGGYDDDGCKAFIATADGGFVMAGYTRSGIGGNISQSSRGATDYWMIKVDANGLKQWDKRFGGSGPDVGTEIAQTPDGGYLIAGHSGSPVAGGDKSENGKGNWDYWVVKTDGNGNKLWDKCYGGPGADYLWAMTLTKDGGALLGGYSDSGIGGDKSEPNRGIFEDYWVVKIDSVGNKQWDKTFGGSIQDFCEDVIQTADGGYLLGGIARSDSSGDKSEDNWGTGSDVWVVKLDSAGNKLWDKSLGTNTDNGFSMCFENSKGNYMVLCGANSGISGNKTIEKGGQWIVTLDPNGNIIHEFSIMGGSQYRSMYEQADGGYIFGTGTATNDTIGDKTEFGSGKWIVRVDSIGNRIWDKTIVVNAGFLTLMTGDGCFATGGGLIVPPNGYQTATNWDTTYDTKDFWLMKFCLEPVGIGPLAPEGETAMQVWPNPAKSSFQVKLPDDMPGAVVAVYDVSGALVTQAIANGYEALVDIQGLSNGLYVVVATSSISPEGEEQYKTARAKLIVE